MKVGAYANIFISSFPESRLPNPSMALKKTGFEIGLQVATAHAMLTYDLYSVLCYSKKRT